MNGLTILILALKCGSYTPSYSVATNFINGLTSDDTNTGVENHSDGLTKALSQYNGVRCQKLIDIINGYGSTGGDYTKAYGQEFFQDIQTCLGYGPNLTLFNNNMDMGQLLKDQGRPNYPESGQLQVYYPSSSGYKYAQGLLSGTSTVSITSSGFNTAVGSGAEALKTASGASKNIANLLASGVWGKNHDWGPICKSGVSRSVS